MDYHNVILLCKLTKTCFVCSYNSIQQNSFLEIICANVQYILNTIINSNVMEMLTVKTVKV